MPNVHRPRAGSLQVWPRVRAKRIYPRIKSWFNSSQISLQGFPGYKAGMTHLTINDNRPHSMTKGQEIVWPATVIECPPIKILALKFYKDTPYGLTSSSQIFTTSKFDKDIAKKLNLPKNYNHENKLKEAENQLDSFHDLRVIIQTQPRKTSTGQKKPQLIEIGISGEDVKSKLTFIKGLLNKEIKISDIFKKHQIIDIRAVTKGKGTCGPLKRYGLTLRSHKSEKSRRRGVLGPEGYRKVKFTAPQQGQTGYHQRTEYNKEIIDLGEKYPNPKGGFLRYGLVKNDYVLIKGSIPGSKKRMVVMTQSIRGKKTGSQIEIARVSQRSQQ